MYQMYTMMQQFLQLLLVIDSIFATWFSPYCYPKIGTLIYWEGKTSTLKNIRRMKFIISPIN